jgi:hypothetical protein
MPRVIDTMPLSCTSTFSELLPSPHAQCVKPGVGLTAWLHHRNLRSRGMGVTAIVTPVELSAYAHLEHFAAIRRHGDRAAARPTGHPIWHGALELRQERRTASSPMPTHKGAHNHRCQSGRGRHQQRKPPAWGSPRRRAPDIYCTISSCPGLSSSDPFIRRQPGRAAWQDPLRVDQGGLGKSGVRSAGRNRPG